MIFFTFIKKANVYIDAGDNSISFTHKSEDVLKCTLQDEVNIAIGWCKENHMQADPSKFQAFVIIGKCKINNFTIVSSDNCHVTIPCENSVKMLGVNFDRDFT